MSGGNFTVTENQTVGGESGWTKYVYPATNQSDVSGLSKADIVLEGEVVKGYYWDVSFDIYLETDANWTQGDDNDAVSTSVTFGNRTKVVDVATDQKVTFNIDTQTVNTDRATLFRIFFKGDGDLPQASAAFYLKNFKLKIGRTESAATIS